MEEEIDILPIGSVVILNKASKKIMITGHKMCYINKINKIYDYVGCFYPEGILTSEHYILFNHNDIYKVYHKGYLVK